MADLREGSLLFSLKRLEQDRARDEALAASRKTEAEMAARIRAEHRARLEQEALLRAVEARHSAEAAARREEAARHEAIRTAALERARMEAEQQARIALLEQQQGHERSLATLAADEQRRVLRRALFGAVALAVAAFTAAGGAYLGQARPQGARAQRAETAAVDAYKARIARLEDELARKDRAHAKAEEELKRLKEQAAPR
jgi:colicin import membrane protein